MPRGNPQDVVFAALGACTPWTEDRNESAAMTALRGQIIIDDKLFTIPVQVGKNLPEIIIGVKWLKLFNLVVDYPDVLTAEGSHRRLRLSKPEYR